MAPTQIYTLSLHDALPILLACKVLLISTDSTMSAGMVSNLICRTPDSGEGTLMPSMVVLVRDRKSTRLNSSHTVISYAVFCLKKKKKNNRIKNIESKLEV